MMLEDIAVSREIQVNQMGGTIVAGMPLDAMQLPPNVPAARVEMDAKKAAGYYTPDGAPDADALRDTVGRPLERY